MIKKFTVKNLTHLKCTSVYQPLCTELVLKVRIANAQDTDFIEIELDRSELTYANLIQTCCQELQVEASLVQKIRKLPNTILRKDKDVMRLVDLQELELVVQKKSTIGNYQVPGLKLIY